MQYYPQKKSELYHHGIKGQKWGVRRYQNYDGTYTKQGLARYNKASDNYEAAKQKLKNARQSGGAEAISSAKREAKNAKNTMNTEYAKLRRDNLADQGRQLHQSGHTISGDISIGLAKSLSVTAMGGAALTLLSTTGPVGALAGSAIAAGAALTSSVIGYNTVQNATKVGSYYEHER